MIFKKYDKNNDGGLDRNETRELMTDMLRSQNRPYTEEQLEEFIAVADTNKDGLIQKKELYNLFKLIGKNTKKQ